jgi:hypothetical protein
LRLDLRRSLAQAPPSYLGHKAKNSRLRPLSPVSGNCERFNSWNDCGSDIGPILRNLEQGLQTEPATSGIVAMKLAGFLLLLAGWAIVLAALAVLASGMAQNCFIAAGVGVEVIGLVLVIRAHPVLRGERG